MDNVEVINTSEQQPPRLNFLQRFLYDPWEDRIVETPRETTGPLMTPLMSIREHMPKFLSPVAKENADGTPAQEYEKLLPPTDVAAVFISQYQNQTPNATAGREGFPYKLKAVGRVNAMDIFNRAGQPGEIVSTTVQVVP